MSAASHQPHHPSGWRDSKLKLAASNQKMTEHTRDLRMRCPRWPKSGDPLTTCEAHPANASTVDPKQLDFDSQIVKWTGPWYLRLIYSCAITSLHWGVAGRASSCRCVKLIKPVPPTAGVCFGCCPSSSIGKVVQKAVSLSHIYCRVQDEGQNRDSCVALCGSRCGRQLQRPHGTSHANCANCHL